MSVIYLDNNATTRVAPEVFEVMRPLFEELYGNASSMHSFGGQLGKYIAKSREQIANLIGALPEEIVFTSCGTESDTTAIMSALEVQANKRHIVTTAVEHPAIINLCQHLEKKGYEITYLPVDEQGRLDLFELKKSLRDDTAIVSIMQANNETGTIFPLEEIAQIVKEKGILLHSDVVQSVGKVPLDMSKMPIDFLALSGHKLHAPKGIGVLYIRKGTRFRPFLRGGHQERGRRAGTENTPYIVGLGKACELAKEHGKEDYARVATLRDLLEQGICKAVSDVKVNGDIANRLPTTTNMSFGYIEGESILLMLDQYGICASSGSACTSGSLEPSHVLRAMNVPFTFAHGSIRFSLSRYTTVEEINKTLEVLPPIVERLRLMSPFKK